VALERQPPGTADDELVDALVQSAFRVVAELTRIAAAHDLSLTQLRVLGILRDREHVRIGDLAGHLGLERSTLSGLVDRAEQRGLLRRTRDDADRRATEVELTADGRALARDLARAAADRLAPPLAALDDGQRHTLLGLLAAAAG
jgi:DNA-binding MarR family transcriptional regulator